MPRICEGQAGPMAPRSEKTVPRAHGTRFEGLQMLISRQASEGLGSMAGSLGVSSKSPWDQVLGPWGSVPRAHGTRFEGTQEFISRQGSEGLGSGAGPLEASSKSPWDQVLGPWGVSSKSPWDQV